MSTLGNLYSFPLELLKELKEVASEQSGASKQINEDFSEVSSDLKSLRLGSSGQSEDKGLEPASDAGPTCQACSIGVTLPGFSNSTEQRQHFKTDWHRFNVKRRLARQAPLTESQFEQLLEQHESEVSSISGSSSEGSEDEDSAAAFSRRTGIQSSVPPQIVFASRDGQRYCVWKTLLEKDGRKGLESSPNAQLASDLVQLRRKPGVFAVILLRGGHFAASVFRARSTADMEGGSEHIQGEGASAGDQTFEVLAHKTFHRYVIRAKAGGKQSTKDNTGKHAKSAGAALRRYNEAGLEEDIAALMSSWRPWLHSADRIFVQLPSSGSKAIFSADPSPQVSGPSKAQDSRGLSSADSRVRRIPFVTQRPTFSESRRVLGLLTSVFEPSASLLAAEQSAADARRAAAFEKERRKRSKEEMKAQQRSAQAAPAGAGGAAGGDEGGGGRKTSDLLQTPLHRAARAGDAEKVESLLTSGADVTVKDARGSTAYLVASTKEVRDAFRRFMAAEPDKWDYAASGIPSPLTSDLEAAQAAKKAEKRARQKEKENERKAAAAEKKKVADEQAKASLDDEIARAVAEASKLSAKQGKGGTKGAGDKVGGVAGGARNQAGSSRAAASSRESVPRTPEDMARRRDVLAAAAEARMKAIQEAAGSQRLY